jgi:hypothetical protein
LTGELKVISGFDGGKQKLAFAMLVNAIGVTTIIESVTISVKAEALFLSI